MGYVKAASTRDLLPKKAMGLELEGRSILLATFENKYYAIGNRCTHMACMLSDGTLRGYRIECPCHKSNFDIRTGKVVKEPAQEPEQVLDVKLEEDQILINV